MQRRLAAILSADVVGYSGLMEADDAGTLARLKANRAAIFDPAVARHGGRIFKLMGDGALAEFASVVAAVACALEIQEETEKASDGPQEKRIRYRIGVNLGDVMVEDDGDIYGEGVNVAARIQMLAPEGGVALSRGAREQVRGKIDCEFDDRGEHTVKNIATPVHVFFARGGAAFPSVAVGAQMPRARRAPSGWRGLVAVAMARPGALAGGAIALLLMIGLVAFFLPRASQSASGGNVAVLPFDNIGEASANYLSEGLGDELRNALMQVHDLHVLARDSSRAFHTTPLERNKLAQQLNIGRLIEGTFRKERGRLYVSVQIVDGVTGFQTWAQTFENPEGELLKLQQTVAGAVAAALTGRSEAAHELPAPPSQNISAYDALLLARNYENQVRNAAYVDEKKLAKAIDFYRVAVRADPNSALARSRLAGALLYAGKPEAAELEIEQAVALNPDLSEVQTVLANYDFARGRRGAEKAFTRAVALNPNNVEALSGLAGCRWNHAKDPRKEAGDLYRRALDLDPMTLRRYSEIGYFYGVTGQRTKALEIVEAIATRFSNPTGLSASAQILEQTGDLDLAVTAVKKALGLKPGDGELKSQLAELYAEVGDFATAARYEPEPGIGQLFWRRDYQGLINLGEIAAIERPEETQIWYLLGFAYAARDKTENAVRVLRIAGLPDRIYVSDFGIGNDHAALMTFAAALKKTGAVDEAQRMASLALQIGERFRDTHADQGPWSNTIVACALATLGKDDEAMAAFSQVNKGYALPRMPWLRDQLCFRRFQSDPRYRAVIADVEKRFADLRKRMAAS